MTLAILEMHLRIALDRFTLEVRHDVRRRTTGIYGPSGSGKTTWLEALAGLRRIDDGLVRFQGTTWYEAAARIHVPPEKRRIGYVPQDDLLFPHYDVRRNLSMATHRARSGSEELLKETVAALEIDALLDRRVQELSGGERRRVALARALCSDPQLLLLDEPFAFLDQALRRRILTYLLQVRERFAGPIIIVSHQADELQELCDELVHLAHGRIVEKL